MLRCEDFARICMEHDLTFFTGVPDSTFKSWMNFLQRQSDLTNILAVNECEAVAICTGCHLSTGKIGVLYMQNSGLAKSVDPLTSLCNPEVYSIPLLLMIGWRGEPGKKDAYQHHKMGCITLPLLELLAIPYEILPANIKGVEKTLKRAKDYMEKNSNPFSIVIRRGVFEEDRYGPKKNLKEMTREEAIKIIMECLDGDEIVISNTGKTSRELFEYRTTKKQGYQKDFYNIGAMGCTQSIALGIVLQKRDKKIFVLDGDGSVLMEMGALATIGHYSPENFHHIVFDNQAHDSTGGQPTCSDTVQFDRVALACNYKYAKVVEKKMALIKAIRECKREKGPSMLVVKVEKGAREDLGRPPKTPVEYKKNLMDYLGGS